MISHDEMLDGVAAHALGVLPANEAAAVIEHLRSCEQCREEYRLLRPAVTAVAISAEACADPSQGGVVVSPLLKARIMRQVSAPATRSARIRVWPAYAVAAACLAFALVTGLIDLALNARINRDTLQAVAQQQAVSDFAAADSQRRPFAGGEVLTHGPRLYIALRNAPAPPAGKVYQAWTLAKGAKSVAPSITFEPVRGGVAVVKLPESATTLAAVAISVEPFGGSLQPTTKPFAVVRL
jgi:anti-sigma-K factor RskA